MKLVTIAYKNIMKTYTLYILNENNSKRVWSNHCWWCVNFIASSLWSLSTQYYFLIIINGLLTLNQMDWLCSIVPNILNVFVITQCLVYTLLCISCHSPKLKPPFTIHSQFILNSSLTLVISDLVFDIIFCSWLNILVWPWPDAEQRRRKD